MPDIYLVSYADNKYKNSQAALVSESKNLNYTGSIEYSDLFLRENGFYGEHLHILTALPNGGCLWKPYIILDSMNRLPDGTIIHYSDCGDSIHPGYKEFILKNTQDFFFIHTQWVNSQWTKKSCFVFMKCDEERYWIAPQLEAGQIAFVNNNRTRDFVSEWLFWCKNPDIILDTLFLPEDYGYPIIRHSRDQSILTNLQVKYYLPSFHILEVEYKYVNHNVRTG